MATAFFTTAPDTAYKFKDATGKWTQLLSFTKLGTFGGKPVAFFKPETDRLSTDKEHVIQVFVGPTEPEQYRKFICCKFYGTWEQAPHECGKHCPLSK